MYQIHHADCFDWLRACQPRSLHAVCTDPPYGVLEFTKKEVPKLRAGRGGVWRLPPKRQEEIGNYCERGKGKTVYRRKTDGIVLGLTFSIDYEKGKAWFLGLPKDSFQEAVLLCQCGPRSVKIIHLRKDFWERHGSSRLA